MVWGCQRVEVEGAGAAGERSARASPGASGGGRVVSLPGRASPSLVASGPEGVFA